MTFSAVTSYFLEVTIAFNDVKMIRQKRTHNSKSRKTHSHSHIEPLDYHDSTSAISSDFAGFVDPVLDGSAIFDELSQKRQVCPTSHASSYLTNIYMKQPLLDRRY